MLHHSGLCQMSYDKEHCVWHEKSRQVKNKIKTKMGLVVGWVVSLPPPQTVVCLISITGTVFSTFFLWPFL